jgi:hypothetical protein
MGDTREVLVWSPPRGEDPDEVFPTLYLFSHDGALMQFGVGAARLLANREGAPKMVVVGITVLNPVADCTPTPIPDREGSGQADKYLRYLRTELIPWVEEHYPVGDRRVIVGHSIIGTLCVYALLKDPDLFSDMVISSPWMIYDGDERFLLTSACEELSKPDRDASRVYLTVGDEPRLTGEVRELAEAFGTCGVDGLEWTLKEEPGEDHASVMAGAMLSGLRWVLSTPEE